MMTLLELYQRIGIVCVVIPWVEIGQVLRGIASRFRIYGHVVDTVNEHLVIKHMDFRVVTFGIK